jgi:hypothetical protein
MYKNYINGFSFFKGIENREFIVKVISKLTPIFGSRGDILIQEGEHIEEIIFIKNGILSLEVWIDMINPEESIEKYLYDNGFISQKEKKESVHKENSSAHRRSSIISIFGQNKKNLNTSFNNYFEKIENKNEIAINDNKSILKILDIRRNEHFGDVFMFLNKKSPLYVRVASKNVDLLLLKKLDSIDISDRFPDVWKTIIKRPLENSKMIANLTLKSLTIFCNLNGIKTKLFKKKKDNKYFPSYYLIPIINKKGEISPKTKKNFRFTKNKSMKVISYTNNKTNSRNNFLSNIYGKISKRQKELNGLKLSKKNFSKSIDNIANKKSINKYEEGAMDIESFIYEPERSHLKYKTPYRPFKEKIERYNSKDNSLYDNNKNDIINNKKSFLYNFNNVEPKKSGWKMTTSLESAKLYKKMKTGFIFNKSIINSNDSNNNNATSFEAKKNINNKKHNENSFRNSIYALNIRNSSEHNKKNEVYYSNLMKKDKQNNNDRNYKLFNHLRRMNNEIY